jgi:hypothetical protein
MSNVPQQKTVIDPELSDVLALQKTDVFASLNCVKVGKITAFDGTKKTAQIKVLFKRQYPDGTAASYPVLLDCPVFTLQGGGAYVQMPVAVGDHCLVLFSDRSLDDWFQNGAEAIPSNPRMHDISDGIAIVGLNPLSNSGPVTPSDKVVISYQGTTMTLAASGFIFKGAGGAEVDLAAAIVTIKNQTTTLLTLMNGFITLLEGAQVQGPSVFPFTAGFISLLEAYKAQFAGLLG